MKYWIHYIKLSLSVEPNRKSDKTPTPIILKYSENPNRPGTYDLVDQSDDLSIKYFILSQPRIERFKRQGAAIMCEAWNKEGKFLFTGLRPLIGSSNVFYGDHKRKGQKKSFFCLIRSGSTYEMLYFIGFCPRSNTEQTRFLHWYFREQFIEAR